MVRAIAYDLQYYTVEPFAMSVESPVVLQLDSLVKQFKGQPEPAVKGVSLSLNTGELLGLLGPSGCGKTTLLRLIAGFERPQSGVIALSGRSVCGQGRWLPPERRDVGVVFQDYALFPHLSVMDNVAFGLKSQVRRGKFAPDQIREEAQRAIALVNLTGFEKRFPHELSGGQQQRVALARALAPRPSLVLLDEPFSNLDVQVRLYLRQEVRDILKSVKASGVFVTHDQEEALSISDQLAVMHHGQLEQLDVPEAVYLQPCSRFVAGFVTQANFLPAQRVGAVWQTVLGNFPVEGVTVTAAAAATATAGTADQGELMVPQEALTLQPDPAGPLVVRDRQFLGREYRYTLTTKTGQRLFARTPVQVAQLAPGTPVRGVISAHQVSVFPAATDAASRPSVVAPRG